MKIIEAHAATPIGRAISAAVIHFDRGYYWEVPANRHDAVKISELAEDLAGVDIDGIVFFGGDQEMAIRVDGNKSNATSFRAAFQANKLCSGQRSD